MEPREDFTSADGVMWPMYVTKDGNLYSYCPGKATWDVGAVSLYQALVITAETGIMYEDGPISKQPHWWVELLSWFLPQYRDKIFWTRAKIILGSDKATETAKKMF